MKVIGLQGSPRRKGSTALMMGWLAEELRAGGHEVEIIDMAARQVRACMGCLTCQQAPDTLTCAIGDEGNAIMERMAAADAVIYATPLYCWGFSGHIKSLLDRHLAFVTGFGDPAAHRSHLAGKRAALLVCCGGPAGPGNTDLIEEQFRRLMAFAQMEIVALEIAGSLHGPHQLNDTHRAQAHRLATALTS